MVQKEKRKEVKGKSIKVNKAKTTAKTTMDLLLENSIALQKTIASLAIELKSLNKKISSMLKLFEDANKAFKETRKEGIATPAEMPISGELMEKIEELLKQNKTIANGILLLEKALRESTKEKEKPAKEYKPKPLPEFTF